MPSMETVQCKMPLIPKIPLNSLKLWTGANPVANVGMAGFVPTVSQVTDFIKTARPGILCIVLNSV